MPEKKPFYGWWVVAASFVTFGISVGLPYYNMPFFYDYFAKNFGWARSQITLGFPIAAILTLWVGPVLVPKLSPRRSILIGTGLTFLAFLGFSQMSGNLTVYYAPLVPLHHGLHSLRPHSAPGDRVALVPQTPRIRHGDRLHRRGGGRVARAPCW